MKRAMGVDITGAALHFVELEKTQEGYKLLSALTIPTKLFSANLEDSQKEAVLETTADLTQKYLSAGVIGRKGVVGFSGAGLIIRYTRIMQAPSARQKMLIDFEIKEMTAQGGEGLLSSFRKLPIESPTGDDTIMVALAKDEFLEETNAQLKKIGLKSTYFTPSCVALYNAFLLSDYVSEEDVVMLVALDRETTEMILVDNGLLIFARNINSGGQLLVDALLEKKKLNPDKAWQLLLNKGDISPPSSGREGSAIQVALWGAGEQLFRVLESSINFARLQLRMPRLDVKKIFLTGELARLKGLKEFLTTRFQRSVEYLNPLAALDKSKLAETIGKKQAQIVSKNPYPYAIAAGLARLAIENEAFKLELQPSSFERKSKFLSRALFMYLGILALVIMLAFKAVAYNSEAAKADNVKKYFQQRTAKMKADAKALERIVKEVKERKPIAQSLQAALFPSLNFYKVVEKIREFANAHPEIIVEQINLVPFEEPQFDKEGSNYKLDIKLFFENLTGKTQQQLSSFEDFLNKNVGDSIISFNPTPLKPPQNTSLSQAEYYEIIIELCSKGK